MNEKNPSKPDVGIILLEELTPSSKPHQKKRGLGQTLLIPILAIFTGLIIGGLFIVFTSVEVYAAFGKSFGAGLAEAWKTASISYVALFYGAIGDPAAIVKALASGNKIEIIRAFNPFMESLVSSTPYIFGGLALALAFRSGVFNIGAEGQVFTGALLATFVAYSIKGLPAIIHIPLSIIAGFVGGAIWGFIPGWLKAKTGGHEVINTIMMNYIAFLLSDWLLRGPMRRPETLNPVSPTIQPSAAYPLLVPAPSRLHMGFIFALIAVYAVYYLMFKTTLGFNLRSVGANLNAAKYAGINVPLNIILAMTISGGIAGLAGANEVLGVNHNLAVSFSSGYGFDSIALALLGNNNPIGVLFAALLFGALRNGATNMQLAANVPIDIISILQAVILIFIAAPAIIRTIYRLRKPAEGEGLAVVGGS